MKTKLSRFAVPYVVWMAIFVVAPIVIMVIYAFSNGAAPRWTTSCRWAATPRCSAGPSSWR